MIGMAFRFIKSMLRHQWAKLCGYEPIAPPGVQAWRNRKCEKCMYNDEGQCALCDCLILAKVMMSLEKCPDGRWSPVWIKKRWTGKR